MIKLKRRGLVLFLIIILMTTFTTDAFADKLTTKLKKHQKQLAKNKATYQGILDKIDDIDSSIEVLDSQIEDIMLKMDATNSKISSVKHDIVVAQKAIDNTCDSINSEQAMYNKRLRAMYMNGPTGYLELIINSKSFVDFLERYELTKSVMKFDTNLIGSLQNKKKTKERQKAVLVQKKNELVRLQNINKANLAQRNAKRIQQQNLITYLNAQKKKYKAAIDAQNSIINATRKQIAALAKKLKHFPTGKYSSDAVVVYAARFLGTKYVWGGTTPRGFDCSGFTKYVYGHFGIKISRVSRDQANDGPHVSKGQLRAGDLVFFGSPIHHVGIYVGNNSFIEAPQTGDVVKISPLTRRDFRFGVRIR